MQEYPITCENKSVGTAQVTVEGLYYRIRCYCTQEARPPRRILMRSEAASVDLGICVPDGNRFSLNTRIAVKRLGKGDFSFHLSSPGNEKEIFYVVDKNKPFPHLPSIKKARFAVQDGKAGLCVYTIKGQFPTQQGSDPNRKYQSRSVWQ